jgi:hypothetical protein
MTHFAAITKTTCASVLSLLLASACGGNSFSGNDDAKGGSSSAGSSAGGSQAGKHQGGSASGGTASGGASTAGAGGSSPGGAACNAPPSAGNCEAYFEVWYHDPSTGLCRPFVYGGCGGNENNYPTFEACQKACPGGSPNYDACSAATDCMITGVSCCGICDSPDLTERSLLAHNKKYVGQVQQCAFAAEGAAPPEDIACAPCPALLGDTGSLKYFVPNCVQGQCVVEDIRSSSVSACAADADCYVRNGNSCCGSCSQQSIALSKNGGFETLVCGGEQPPCDACIIAPNSDIAVCGASGHCEVRVAIPAGR